MSPPASVAASPIVSRSADHDNGFGLMRLVFATLVLVSHGPELLDGNRGREILTQVFGGLSFGEFAVDGFFVISGALITASWMNAASARDYLWRRITRIYPGFLAAIAAIAVSVLVVAPLGGGGLARVRDPLSDSDRGAGPCPARHRPGLCRPALCPVECDDVDDLL